METLRDARIRFNWGFHDGAGDALAHVLPREMDGHFDQVYAAGYVDGYRSALAGTYTEDSTEAWDARQACDAKATIAELGR